jgi:hypothetical protein
MASEARAIQAIIFWIATPIAWARNDGGVGYARGLFFKKESSSFLVALYFPLSIKSNGVSKIL